MADNNIRFKISSVFTGEGFTRANNALQETGRVGNQAAQAANRIGGALGQLEGPAGKASRAVTGVIGAITQMGVVGGIVAAAEVGISFAINKIKDHYDQLAEKVKLANERMKEKLAAAVKREFDEVDSALRKVGKDTDANIKSFDTMAAAAKKVNEAIGKTQNAQGAANAVNISLQALNQKLTDQTANAKLLDAAQEEVRKAYLNYVNAHSLKDQQDAEKLLKTATENLERVRRENAVKEMAVKLHEAEANLKLVLDERSRAEESRSSEVRAAEAEEQHINEKCWNASDNVAAAREALAKAHEHFEQLENANVDDAKALEDARRQITEAEKIVEQREDEFRAVVVESKVAREKVKQADIALETTQKQYELRVKEAEYSVKQLNDAYERGKEALVEADKIQSELTSREQQRDDLKQQLANTTEQHDRQRLEILTKLKQAEQDSADWEVKAGKAAEKKYTMMERLQLDEWLRHGEKCLTEQQKQQCADYKEWLYHQGDNPFTNIIEQLKMDLTAIDGQMKDDISNIRSGIDKTDEAINSMTRMLQQTIQMR